MQELDKQALAQCWLKLPCLGALDDFSLRTPGAKSGMGAPASAQEQQQSHRGEARASLGQPSAPPPVPSRDGGAEGRFTNGLSGPQAMYGGGGVAGGFGSFGGYGGGFAPHHYSPYSHTRLGYGGYGGYGGYRFVSQRVTQALCICVSVCLCFCVPVCLCVCQCFAFWWCCVLLGWVLSFLNCV